MTHQSLTLTGPEVGWALAWYKGEPKDMDGCVQTGILLWASTNERTNDDGTRRDDANGETQFLFNPERAKGDENEPI